MLEEVNFAPNLDSSLSSRESSEAALKLNSIAFSSSIVQALTYLLSTHT